MLPGAGGAQSLNCVGSSPYIPIRPAGVAESSCTSLMEIASASPTGRRKGGLLKGLKRIGTLFSGNSSIGTGPSGSRPGSDPSQRNSLAHAISNLEIPATTPISKSTSPSPSYMDFVRNHRLDSSLRSGGVGSPPIEPHSPCSPFPASGPKLIPEADNRSMRGEDRSLCCHVRACVTPPVSVSASSTNHAQAQHLSSPVTVASLLVSPSSPFGSGSSGSGRLEKMSPVPTCASVTPACSREAPVAQSPLAATPLPYYAPAAAPPSAPRPASTLLALNPALPDAMRRRTWCLEDYRVIKRLYKGGSASVYKATCLRSGSPVALKVYFLTKVPRNVVHMIKREIELHHQLVHPNIIQLYGAFLHGERIVLVQEYAARGDLFHLLQQMGGRMTEAQVSEVVMRPFLDALAYLHSRGICHRDIKPENILYNEQWVLKVADFGVSINLNVERAVTRAGTIDYMAPEVTRCPLKAEPNDNKDNPSLAYTSAVDIWACGVLTYELLVGFAPMVAPRQQGASKALPEDQNGVAKLLEAYATPKTLHFPSSLSLAVRNFILSTLADAPCDRPTAKELLRQGWITDQAGLALGAGKVAGAAAGTSASAVKSG